MYILIGQQGIQQAAKSRGCRVVATALPGVKELLGSGNGADFVELVKVPRLENVDAPVAADQAAFETHLMDALVRQITAAGKQPDIDLGLIKDRLAAFSWQGVFEKIQHIYYQCR